MHQQLHAERRATLYNTTDKQRSTLHINRSLSHCADIRGAHPPWPTSGSTHITLARCPSSSWRVDALDVRKAGVGRGEWRW
eukprot:scaffold55710_cov25-Tisochrysis_lutea.AAC.8